MDPTTLTTITAAFGAAKTGIEAVRAALAKGKVSRETLTLVDGLQARIFELQEIAFRLHEEKVQAIKAKEEALEENAQLRKDVRQKEEGATDRDNYQRRKFGSAAVVVRKDEPDTYLCATCFERGDKVYLSPLPSAMRMIGTYQCKKCKGTV
ncbi:MAG: hypothetical protein WAM82_31470 [Thermoanaerobaculia bacterium]